jgi:acetoin utilization deacetylase AcuC-like enzyme
VDIYYTDRFVLPLPPGHRFPMRKYELLRERVEASLVPPHALLVPAAATDEALQRVHTPAYVRRVTTGAMTDAERRRIGFPWSPEMVERSRRSVGATIAAAGAALRDGIAVNLAGGTHHAFADRGEGFCVFNDVAVAARIVQRAAPARIAIVDCDVHQGNGTAAIFAGDASVFTFSVHGEANFPFRKERSDLDIALPDGAGDPVFLDAVERGVTAALATRPDLGFYLSGADPWEGDRLGRLSVTKSALARRDRLVLESFRTAGVPVVVVMGGGYPARVEDAVDIHYATVCAAAALAALPRAASTSL